MDKIDKTVKADERLEKIVESHRNDWKNPRSLSAEKTDEATEKGLDNNDELEYILAQVDYQIDTGSAFELEILQQFKKLVECAVARKNAIAAYWDKKAGRITYKEMCDKIKEFGKREEEITK